MHSYFVSRNMEWTAGGPSFSRPFRHSDLSCHRRQRGQSAFMLDVLREAWSTLHAVRSRTNDTHSLPKEGFRER